MGPRVHSKTQSTHQFLDVPLANTSFHSPFSVPFRLTSTKSPHQSARAQLQRQRLQEQHASSADSNLYSNAALVNKAIPGLKTSVAFFGSLRTNLRLHASPPLASPLLTPNSLRAISGPYFPPLSPLATPSDLNPIMDPIAATSSPDDPSSSLTAHDAAAAAPTSDDPLSGVPELHTYRATTSEDRSDALKLVADSIAQQRQAANTALIFHPLNIAVAGGVLAVVGRAMRTAGWDWSLVGTTVAGVLMSLLLVCRFLTQDYLHAAEAINFAWLGDDAEVLVTKFGEEIIGAAVVDWVPANGSGVGGGGSGGGNKRKRNWRGSIRAWTVRMRYRGKGVGTALLEEVVREAREKGTAGVWFDAEHASELPRLMIPRFLGGFGATHTDRSADSKRVLPQIYNGMFVKHERKAEALLQSIIDSTTGKGKRK